MQAKQHSMAKVMLTVFKDNAAALALYKKLGYQIDETSPDYGASGDSAAAAVGYSIMSKRTSAVVAAS